MRSLHNNLVKSGNILKNEEARVIDSNTKIAERLQYLHEILQVSPDGEFSDEFSAGLDALQVEQLLGDPDAQGMPMQQEPAIDTQALDEMKAEAQAQVDEMLSAAREEAESIIQAAKAEADAVRDKARADGHEEGYRSGYDEGMQIANEAELELQRKESELQAYYDSKIEELEPLFVDKITDIYEQIFKVKLSEQKELILYLLSDAIRNVEGGKSFLVHVSQDDYEFVCEHREDLKKGLPSTAILEVIEDLTLSQTQCFVESESGIFDCGLGTELSLLKKELTLLSYKA